MKIEFKLNKTNGVQHKETFKALSEMLDVIDRQSSLNSKVCAVMDSTEENLPDVVDIKYIQDGFQVEFLYFKDSNKIMLKSRKV